MPCEIQSEADLSGIGNMPKVLTVSDILSLDVSGPSMLIEQILPADSAVLIVGASKAGKTLLAAQMGIAIASGKSLFGYYPVVKSGPVLMLEQDDPRGAASVKQILECSPVQVRSIPFFSIDRAPFSLGDEFVTWLESLITQYKLCFCILDSYTALRGSRRANIDIVKAEQADLAMLDELAKRTRCTIAILHHTTASKSGLDWTLQAGGTFAMGMATEAQIHISRFGDLPGTATERLIRSRGRHVDGIEVVLRFRRESLDYKFVLDGGGAPLYPFILEIREKFGGKTFSPKDLMLATGVGIRTVHRNLDRLSNACDVLTKTGHGQYVLAGAWR